MLFSTSLGDVDFTFDPKHPRLHPRYEFWKNHPELWANLKAHEPKPPIEVVGPINNITGLGDANRFSPARLFWGKFSRNITPPKIQDMKGLGQVNHPILFWGAVAGLGYYLFLRKK